MNKSINIAIMIGRSGSKGLPGKNVRKVLGRPLAEYPIIAAKKSIIYLFLSSIRITNFFC